MRPRRMISSACSTASPGASPTCSPPSSTSAFEPTPSPSTTVNSTPRSPEAASAESRSNRLIGSLERLDEHVDLAAAGQTDAPGDVVLDAVAQRASAPPCGRPPGRSRTRRSRRTRPRRSRTSCPDSEIARLAPIGRGAERRVATTVATTTFSPSFFHASISGRISFTRRIITIATRCPSSYDPYSLQRMADQAAVSLLRWLRRQLRQPTPQREHLEAAVANDDPAEARRLVALVPFTDAQRRHVDGLIDRWEQETARARD